MVNEYVGQLQCGASTDRVTIHCTIDELLVTGENYIKLGYDTFTAHEFDSKNNLLRTIQFSYDNNKLNVVFWRYVEGKKNFLT